MTVKKADPAKTRTGKTRLGPLNLSQLEKLLETARPRHRNAIHRRIVHVRSMMV